MEDGKERFTKKANVYSEARPEYPISIVEKILKKQGKDPVVVDVGAGTGKFTKVLLTLAYTVFAVEPNFEMRSKLQEKHGHYSNLQILDGSAEEIPLKNNFADLITAAHAFHYFNPEKAKTEFQRVLKPGGKVFLVWNWRALERDISMREYREIVYSCAIKEPTHAQDKMTDELFKKFFNTYEKLPIVANDEYITLETLLKRAESTNHAPNKGDPKYDLLINRLTDWFETYQQDGKVKFCIDTTSYYGSFEKTNVKVSGNKTNRPKIKLENQK